MAIHRGIQSVIFYYLSCAPCTGYGYHKRLRKEAERGRADKRVLQTEQPDFYRQPSPYATNPYWQEEVTMGPGPPPRRKGKKGVQKSQRNTGTQSANGSHAASSAHSPGQMEGLPGVDEDDPNWNFRRYQREDEALWGMRPPPQARIRPVRNQSTGGSSIGLAGLSQPDNAQASTGSWYTARNPPLNDLHPSVVSLLSSNPEDSRWMLQPPPSAKVMEGKEPANRSRSDSGGSSRSRLRGTEPALGKKVSKKLLEDKIRRGQTPEMPSLSRGNSHNTPNGQPHDRDPNMSFIEEDAWKNRRAGTLQASEDSAQSTQTVVHNPSAAAKVEPDSDVASLLRLETAAQLRSQRQLLFNGSLPTSGSLPKENTSPHSSRQYSQPPSSSEDSTPERAVLLDKRPALALTDSSLNVLQARIQLPPTPGAREERGKKNIPEFDSWYAKTDFRFPSPDEVGGMKRDVRSRWSMDI
ncbi:hypothetical protein LTR04_004107 [Oleoguttula sp. CCFEE 6159]|nr:hypothetical protein LTR04_004107 [Oleoguttula sp. CCFEE 6159]